MLNSSKFHVDDWVYENQKRLFIKSDVMTGKSTDIRAFIKSHPKSKFLYLVNRISQAYEFEQVCKSLGIACLNYKRLRKMFRDTQERKNV